MSVHTAYWPTISWPTMTRLWQSLLAHLDMSEEPRVWPRLDQAGNPAWNAYDPVTGQSVHLLSEAELRTWLEELHYHEQRFAEARQADLKLLWP
jgi:hypothetical protein